MGYGSAVQSCLEAASMLGERGIKITVADARFCKPLDVALIRSLAKSHEVLVTVEEGSIGGFGSHVVQFLALDGHLDGKLKVHLHFYTFFIFIYIPFGLSIQMFCIFDKSGDQWYYLTGISNTDHQWINLLKLASQRLTLQPLHLT